MLGNVRFSLRLAPLDTHLPASGPVIYGAVHVFIFILKIICIAVQHPSFCICRPGRSSSCQVLDVSVSSDTLSTIASLCPSYGWVLMTCFR